MTQRKAIKNSGKEKNCLMSINSTKPSLFIGSSSEGIEIARALEFNLQDDAESTVWNEGVFGLSAGTLEALVTALDRFDFAILVLTPDDVTTSRDITSQAPRDNVMFELGLFMGRLGRERTFAVYSKDSKMKLPSDLAGVTLANFDPNRKDKNLLAAVGPACTMIRQSIRSLGVTQTRGLARLNTATSQMEGVSDQVTQIVSLLARSRVAELEIIDKQFGMFIQDDSLKKIRSDLVDLESTTAGKKISIIVLDHNKLPVPNADVLLIAENGTYVRSFAGQQGKAEFTIAKRRLLSVYCAHPNYPAVLREDFDPIADLSIAFAPSNETGSVISLREWKSIPGLSGTINAIHDSSDRLYVYTENISVNKSSHQPASFQIGEALQFEDANGQERTVTFLSVVGDCFLIDYRPNT